MKESLPVTSPTVRKGHLFPVMFTLVAFIMFVLILYGQEYFSSSSPNNFNDHLALQPFNLSLHPINNNPKPLIKSVDYGLMKRNKIEDSGDIRKEKQKQKQKQKQRKREKLPFALGEGEEECDIFDGKWVRDNNNKPMYQEWECPYIQPQLTCQAHGRPDRDYQFWRWQPRACDLPKFNATLMLEALRNKRMLFVGDSLNRGQIGQYVSMICLLNRLAPQEAKSLDISFNSLTVFGFKEYNATIEFYWAPFLLESNTENGESERIIRNGSINTHGKHWKGADVVIFNTYIWWMTGLNMKILKGSFEDKIQEIEELPTDEAYRMGMKSMLKWVETNMDPNKTRVFFTSMSPMHSKSIDWGGEPGGNCYNETTMIEDPNYWGSDSRKSIMKVIGEEMSKSKVPMSFLNITQLSSYRKDAHTQIYQMQWSPLTPEQQANPKSYVDCIHWCQPGLQDTWNELLFAKLFYP